MWSDSYYYLNIYKDEKLSSEIDTDELRTFISTIPALEKNGEYKFKNTKDFPFIDLLLLKVNDVNNWNENDFNSKKTNMIAIVCSKGNEVNFKKIKFVLIKIASFLNWELVNEETDDGIENDTMWTNQIND